MKRITLTQYSNDGKGLPVEIDPDIICAITPLNPMQGETVNEHPCRTRVDTTSWQSWVVSESLKEINAAIAKVT